MTELRGEEKVAAATITATLGLRVEPHDDGSQPGMHDLNIIGTDGGLAAVEVTAAARTDFPGSIYLTIERTPERTGGVVDSTGVAVPGWVRQFLLDPHQSDVLGKLARSGASERHAFILVPGLSIAPFGVVDMLWRDKQDVVPTGSPHLPEQVTHVWLMAFWTVGSGLRWSPERGWERFERRFRIDG